MNVELYPAIDLRDGKVVRLLQGDYDQQTTYGDDPVAVARSFVEQGARVDPRRRPRRRAIGVAGESSGGGRDRGAQCAARRGADRRRECALSTTHARSPMRVSLAW